MQIKSTPYSGFSLVELSIVLVIIGLLAGGIIAGQSMIRSSKVAQIVTEKERLISAVGQFKSQYNALPGDMLNATKYWGTDASGCPDNTNRVPKKETCNGDGNSQINSGEVHRMWQHMANAGLLDGLLTGVSGASSNSIGGENAPAGPIENSFNLIYWVGDNEGVWTHASNTFRLNDTYKHNFVTQREGGTAYLSVKEQYQIDKKFDDAVANTGSIVAGFWNTCTDASGTGDTSVNYDFNEDSPFACAPIFTRVLDR